MKDGHVLYVQPETALERLRRNGARIEKKFIKIEHAGLKLLGAIDYLRRFGYSRQSR